jgi:Domain of unknown function (DUF4276)
VSTVWLGCVVEGDGEVIALPVLVRRIAERVDASLYVQVPRPVQVKRNRLGSQFGDLERAIELAVRQIQRPGGILVLFDADDDCPQTVGPEMLRRLHALRSDIPISVVLAKREYEAWFLAAAESIRDQRGLAPDLAPPPDPEGIRGAKEWLRSRMPKHRKYTETSDQAALTALFDLDLARNRSGSFDKCYREIEGLLRSLLPPAPPEDSEAAPAEHSD